MVELFDTHCHLNDAKAYPDPDLIVAEARNGGVTRITVIGCDLESSRAAVEIAARNEGVTATVGWHPGYVETYSADGLAQIRELVQHPKVVAIGEIGLDFYRGRDTEDLQRVALAEQLKMADETGKPIVFHSREAYSELLDILEARGPGDYLLHCFGGDASHVDRGLKIGCTFGVDGPITYKNADVLRETVRRIPLDRLVVETDAPWLTPHPHRGKPNHPKYVRLVTEGLAKTLDLPFEVVGKQTTVNALKFYGLARTESL